MDQSDCQKSESTERYCIRSQQLWYKKYFGSCNQLHRWSAGQSMLFPESKGMTVRYDHFNSFYAEMEHPSFQIIFDFSNPIDGQLKASLIELGIEVRINGKSTVCNASADGCDIKKLNIDVTTMMAYVSSLTSGSFNWQFNEPLLTEQAIKESTCPIKKYLDEIFEGEKEEKMHRRK